jgi:hypothetical protein
MHWRIDIVATKPSSRRNTILPGRCPDIVQSSPTPAWTLTVSLTSRGTTAIIYLLSNTLTGRQWSMLFIRMPISPIGYMRAVMKLAMLQRGESPGTWGYSVMRIQDFQKQYHTSMTLPYLLILHPVSTYLRGCR